MRVAICQETIDVRRGGAETSTLEMARHLRALGAIVTLVASAEPAQLERVCTAEGLGCVAISPAGGKRTRTRRYVEQQARVCRAGAFDIVHAVTPCRVADVYQPRGGTYPETIRRSVALGGARLTRLIRAITRRFNFRQQYLRDIERRLLIQRPGPCVAALSRYVGYQIRRDFPDLPEPQLFDVFNGVDFEPLPADIEAQTRARLRQTWDAQRGRPVALFVAHNFKLKGLAELIRASATATGRAADWLVVVAGRDNARPYQRLAARLAIASRVKFIGAETPVAQLYAASDVLTHPTWYDPCSRVVLEALCAGLPVVTTQWNGAAEAIERGRTGIVISDPGDAESLAGGIAGALGPRLAATCRQAADAAREKLSMARHARELLALYKLILERRAR